MNAKKNQQQQFNKAMSILYGVVRQVYVSDNKMIIIHHSSYDIIDSNWINALVWRTNETQNPKKIEKPTETNESILLEF